MTGIVVLLGINASGGAELSMLAVARGLKREGFNITLAVYGRQRHIARQIAPELTVEDLGVRNSSLALIPFIRLLRKLRPETILSALRITNITALLAASGSGAKVIITEHTPADHGSFLSRLLARCFYPLADAVVAVSQGVADGLKGKVRVIYNPVVSEASSKPSAPPHIWFSENVPVILAIGRLKKEKDFPLLLRAVAATKARLIILGEGKERAALEALARTLGISDRVLFAGFVNDVGAWLAHATLFVSSSRYEGFGNAIVEAMHARIPVIATDCPVGPGEILAGGRFGRLVPVGNAQALATAINETLANPPDTQAAYARAQEFSAARSVSAYAELIRELPPHISLWQRFKRKLCAIIFYEHWMIGVVDAPIAESLGWTRLPKVRWLGERSRQRYFADPFMWPDDPASILCEEYDFTTHKGSITRLQLQGTTIQKEIPVPMPLPGHLSFPFLFAHEGKAYCIPESSAARSLKITVWESGAFKEFATPLADVAAADSALFIHGDLFWIAYTDVDKGPNNNLNLLFAAKLSGPWQPHPGNPVKRDISSSRSGGTPFSAGGMLYRPAQDCSQTYGGAVRIMRIIECTPERYREEEVTRIAPEPGMNPHGFHTLSAYGNKCLVDGKRMIFSLPHVFKKVRRRLAS